MRNIRRPLFYKLLIAFISCSIVPLIIISILMYGLSAKLLNNILYDQTNNNIAMVNNQIQKNLEEYKNIIMTLQNDKKIISILDEEINYENSQKIIYEKIFEALKGQKVKPLLYIMNLSGEITFSSRPIPDIYKIGVKNNWGIFRVINKLGKEIISYPQQIIYSDGPNSILSLGSQIHNDNGICIGYIIIDVPRDIFLEAFKSLNSGVQLHIVILDENSYTVLDIQNPSMEGKFQKAKYLDLEKKAEFKNVFNQIEKDSYLTVFYSDEKLGLTTIANVSSIIFKQLNNIIKLILFIGCLISITICCIISIILAHHISDPIKELIFIMGQVEKGEFQISANFDRNDEIGDLGKYFNQMLSKLKEYLDRIIEKQNELRIAEIKLLQAQINPHFLYNTLDVIKWSAKLGRQEEVTSVVTNLARILRNSIDCDDEFVSVKKSIEFINSYLAIQKIKYDDAFDVNFKINPDIFEYKIPKLILQPIVENAIIHGFSNKKKNGIIDIIADKKDDLLEFIISDNGVGMTDEEIESLFKVKKDQHIGIYNVNQRINLYYGKEYSIRIKSKKNKGTNVIIQIPLYLDKNIG